MNVIHRSEQGNAGSTVLHGVFDERLVTENLAGFKSVVTRHDNDAEPVDRALRDGLRYRPVAVGPWREDPALPDFLAERTGQAVREMSRTTRSDPLPGIGAPLRAVADKADTPVEPGHPDHALLGKLRELVRGLDRHAGKDWDEHSERMAGSALVMARTKGFTPADELQLTLNNATGRHAAGEWLFLSRTGPAASPDPFANRAQMATTEALSKPAQERYQEAAAIGRAQDEALQAAQQQELAQRPDDPGRMALTR